MSKTFRLVFALLLLLVASAVAAQEDDGDLPVIPYITSADSVEDFNVPVPDGWENIGTAGVPHLTLDGVEANFYVLPVGSNDVAAGQLAAIQQIIEDFDATPTYNGDLNLDGNIWTQTVYTLPDDGSVTAFSLPREETVYNLVFVSNADLYMTAVRPDARVGVDEGIREAMTRFFGEDFDADPEATGAVELSNGTWQRYDYGSIDGEPVSAIGQLRGNTTFVVIERGDTNQIESVNKSFFTVLFGFFITPQSDTYLYMGLAATFGLVGLLIVSLWLRFNNARKDEGVIQQLQEDG